MLSCKPSDHVRSVRQRCQLTLTESCQMFCVVSAVHFNQFAGSVNTRGPALHVSSRSAQWAIHQVIACLPLGYSRLLHLFFLVSIMHFVNFQPRLLVTITANRGRASLRVHVSTNPMGPRTCGRENATWQLDTFGGAGCIVFLTSPGACHQLHSARVDNTPRDSYSHCLGKRLLPHWSGQRIEKHVSPKRLNPPSELHSSKTLKTII
jgi:hypothetical protein